MIAAPVVPDILEEHLEELAFLSLQRRRLLHDFETYPHELAAHEERIEAHRAGLAIGGRGSVEIALERLADTVMDWEVCAAVRTWVELGKPVKADVGAVLEATDPERLGGWIEAFRWLAPEHARERLPLDLGAGRAVAADALGWNGALDESSARRLAADDSALVRRAVARTAAAARHFDPLALIASMLSDADASVRRAALFSFALRDPAAAVASLRPRVEEADDFELRLLGLLGAPKDLRPLAFRAAKSPAAIRAIGDVLDPRALDALLTLAGSDDAELALAAVDAVITLTGEPEPPDGAGEPGEVPEDRALSYGELSALVEAKRAELGDASRWLRGRPFPPADEDGRTTEALWRLALAEDDPAKGRRLREVPDGFFDGAPSEEARCGE
jgi:hypothetical protein